MRILVLTADFPPAQWSGIGTAVSHQVGALRELGADVEVLTRERLAGTRFPIEVRADDVVHLHSLSLAELALELTRRYSLPLVYTAHSLLEREVGHRAPEWVALQRRVMDAAARVIFVSDDERAAAISLLPGVADRAHVIPNAVPAPLAPRDYEPDGPIVFAGRFTRNKGFDLVLQVARTIPARFVLAGGHGEPALEAEARTLPPDRCSLPGWLAHHDLETVLACAALVLVPSRYEPFGMVAVEALRAGAPVVASPHVGSIDASESGAAVVEELTAGAWIDAVQSLLRDVDARQAMHRLGPAYVATRFDPARVARTMLNLLHTALASP